MPKFSIVIPARNRADTLYYTLKTCLNQRDFDDYEIVVSDNCSEDNTEEMVNEFNSEKIKYYKTESFLDMVNHWNFAMSKAIGEYVFILGSDDAIHAHGLYFLDRIISITGEKVINCTTNLYNWPNNNTTLYENLFFLYANHATSIINTKEGVKNVVETLWGRGLPHIYAMGVAHKSLVDKLIDKNNINAWPSNCDTYFGFKLASMIDYFVHIHMPFSCAGRSKNSGFTNTAVIEETPISIEFNHAEITSKFYDVGIRSMYNSLTNDFNQVKTKLNVFQDIDIDISKFIRNIIEERYHFAKHHGNEGKDFFQKELATIKDVIENTPEYKANFHGENLNIDDYKFYELARCRIPEINNSILKFNASQFGIDNIYDATLFAEKLLYSKEYIDVYLTKFEENWNKHKNMFALLSKYDRIGIFGVFEHLGGLINAYKYFCRKDAIALFDNDKTKHGTIFCGYKILSPESIPDNKLDALVISSRKTQNEIYESVKKYAQNTEIIKFYDKIGDDVFFKCI